MKRIFAIFMGFALVLCLFAGCHVKKQPGETSTREGEKPALDIDNGEDAVTTDGEAVEVDFSKSDGDMFTQRDHETEYDAAEAVAVTLNGTDTAASSNAVKISGSNVILTQEATYIISGELTDGMLIVDAKDTDKLHLIFSGVNITSKTSAALYILEADKVFVTLAEGTANSLSNGGEFKAIDDHNIDGALFSKQDLTLNGTGSLTVSSPAGHGIVCKDDLVITGGNYVINSASHGLDANDSVRITDAAIAITAGKDAIHVENSDDAEKGFVYISGGSIQAEAEGDGISASAYMQITDGVIDLLVGGGSENGTKQHSDYFGGFGGGGRPGEMRPEKDANSNAEESGTSMKGLKAANGLFISDGSFSINSADDGIHSNAAVVINGGVFDIASGDDAIHADENLTVTAGKIDISTCYEGLEALHVDIQGGDIALEATDDGLNAAGGMDQSGTTGGRDGKFEGGDPGGWGGPGSINSNGSIKISGGTLFITASGDGIDANGTLEITGGHTVVVGPIQGDTATLDYDKTAVITGGTFIGTGSTMMAQSFSDSEQGVIAVKVGNQAAGTLITLKDSKGNTLISQEPELDFAVVILSAPELVKGEVYSLNVGSASGDLKAG